MQVFDPLVDLATAMLQAFLSMKCSNTVQAAALPEWPSHTVPSMQVFDLQEFRPGQVLQQIYKNFEDAERRGDPLAASLKRSARYSWACTTLQN